MELHCIRNRLRGNECGEHVPIWLRRGGSRTTSIGVIATFDWICCQHIKHWLARSWAPPCVMLAAGVTNLHQGLDCLTPRAPAHEARGAPLKAADLVGTSGASPFVGLPGAFSKHRAAVLIDDVDVEALSGLPHHGAFGTLGQIWQALYLAQRRHRHCESWIGRDVRKSGVAALRPSQRSPSLATGAPC